MPEAPDIHEDFLCVAVIGKLLTAR